MHAALQGLIDAQKRELGLAARACGTKRKKAVDVSKAVPVQVSGVFLANLGMLLNKLHAAGCEAPRNEDMILGMMHFEALAQAGGDGPSWRLLGRLPAICRLRDCQSANQDPVEIGGKYGIFTIEFATPGWSHRDDDAVTLGFIPRLGPRTYEVFVGGVQIFTVAPHSDDEDDGGWD